MEPGELPSPHGLSHLPFQAEDRRDTQRVSGKYPLF
jgi:hypothetical protein